MTELAERANALAARAAQSGIYAGLGVRPLINASGHNTAQGGSLMPPPVLEAMREAAGRYVQLRELQDAAGRRIAEVLGVEAALVSAGAASGILLATAACLTGDDRQRIWALPRPPGDAPRNEVVVLGSPRPNYMYQAAEAAGARLVEVGHEQGDGPLAPELFTQAFGRRTAAVLLVVATLDRLRPRTGGAEQFIAGVARAASAAGVPVLVDAAAELPPRANFRRFLDAGAAVAIFSGGKAIRGPQCTGLVLGRRDLIAAAALNNNPNTAIGRPMKVGKEEIAGLVRAVELFMAMDEAEQLRGWERQARTVVDALAGLPGVEAAVVAGHDHYGRPPVAPKAVIRLAPGHWPAPEQVVRALLEGDPPIAISRFGGDLVVNPMTLEPGEIDVVAERLRHILSRA